MRRPLLLAVPLAIALAGACGDDDDRGDPARFCEQLERLTENDPFAALGATATEAEMETAFVALRDRAEDLADLAPPEAAPAAADYRDAVVALDGLLADAGYGPDVDRGAYRRHQVAYTESAARLERYLTAEC